MITIGLFLAVALSNPCCAHKFLENNEINNVARHTHPPKGFSLPGLAPSLQKCTKEISPSSWFLLNPSVKRHNNTNPLRANSFLYDQSLRYWITGFLYTSSSVVLPATCTSALRDPLSFRSFAARQLFFRYSPASAIHFDYCAASRKSPLKLLHLFLWV
jgi:hypothetical protein